MTGRYSTTKELLSQIANMELRDQLEAKEQMIKELKEKLEIAINALKSCKWSKNTIITDKKEVMYIWDYALAEENTKLKELLKEVLRHEMSLKEISELTRKICQALGEDK